MAELFDVLCEVCLEHEVAVTVEDFLDGKLCICCEECEAGFGEDEDAGGE